MAKAPAKFTDRYIDGLPTTGERYEKPEPGRTGLAVRVSQRGVKTFAFVFRFRDKVRRINLGVYRPADLAAHDGAAAHNDDGLTFVTLADARVLLAEAKRKVAAGIDPAMEAVAQHAAERKVETVEELAKLYLERHAAKRKRPRSIAEDERQLNKDVLPRWGNMKITAIKRRHVAELLDDVVDRGPIAANRLHSLLRKIFEFAVRDRGLLDVNPVAAIGKPGGQEVERERIPSDDELRLIWLGAARLEPPFRQFVQTLVLSGQRRTEIAGLQSAEIDRENSLIDFPTERMKGKRPHVLPITEAMLAIIDSVPKPKRPDGAAADIHVFASRTQAGKHINAFDDIKTALDEKIRKIQIEEGGPDAPAMAPWTFHDIRRSVRTTLSDLGFLDEVAERVLAHSREKLGRTYNKSKFLPQKRLAIEAWGKHVETLVEEPSASNVKQFEHRQRKTG